MFGCLTMSEVKNNARTAMPTNEKKIPNLRFIPLIMFLIIIKGLKEGVRRPLIYFLKLLPGSRNLVFLSG